MKNYFFPLARRMMVGIVLLAFIITQDVSAVSSPVKGVMDARTLAMINKPGVVLVQTLWTADLTFYEFAFRGGFAEDMVDAIYNLVETGKIESTEEAVYSAMVKLMIENMAEYVYTTGQVFSERASTAAVGTGFIITPDGYLITNAHVAATNEKDLNVGFAKTALEEYAFEGTERFVDEMKSLGYEMSREEIDGIMNTFYYLLTTHMEVKNLQTSYQCFLGNVNSRGDVSARGVGLKLLKIGEPIPGKDVAVLKLEGTNLPTVKLGYASKLRTGDKVYAMGYPAIATVNDTLNISQAIQEPTLTAGIISARKQMAGGWNIFQMDAAIHGGNSGGPLFNEAGEVIGINTFTMLDPDSGAQVAGMNFAIPINIAVEFLKEINVKPSESEFTLKYKKAINLFQNEKYHQSLEILKSLNETNPGIPMVVELLDECTVLDEQNPQGLLSLVTDSIGGNPIIITAIVGAGTLVVVVIILLTAQNKKKQCRVEPPVKATAIGPDHPVSETMTCVNCGIIIPASSKFCSHCGARIEDKED